jgi:cellulose synthase/poly-beta-1,6-N-acetylglucosamine synthase-like glycosyltransferase
MSIEALNYPPDLLETVVIADNCADETALIAEGRWIICLRRTDRTKRGKGYALQWGIEQLKRLDKFYSFDAFVIIDADTLADPEFLRAMDIRIAQGQKAIQGYYDVVNPEGSPMASLSYFGFVISRNLRFKGRTRLGWSNNLLGNGMCFTREVIERFGWKATSIVEDVEYAVILHMAGIKVNFAPEARIYASIPDTFQESKIQRSRWDIGKFKIRNKYIGPLTAKALKTKDISYLDTAMELLIPPFSLFVLMAVTGFILFLLISYREFNALALIWYTGISALSIYIIFGLTLARAGWKAYKNLIYAPFFLIWRVNTVIWGYLSEVSKQWVKTQR